MPTHTVFAYITPYYNIGAYYENETKTNLRRWGKCLFSRCLNFAFARKIFLNCWLLPYIFRNFAVRLRFFWIISNMVKRFSDRAIIR